MLLLGLLAIFTIAGICEFVYLIRLIFYFPHVKTNSYSLVVLKRDYAVRQLNFLWQKLKWQGEDFASGIIAITDNLDNNEIMNCNKFIVNKKIILSSKQTPFIILRQIIIAIIFSLTLNPSLDIINS